MAPELQVFVSSPGVCSFCWNFEWTHKNLSSGATECRVWIGNCNVKVWKSTEHKLHNIWRSVKFRQNEHTPENCPNLIKTSTPLEELSHQIYTFRSVLFFFIKMELFNFERGAGNFLSYLPFSTTTVEYHLVGYSRRIHPSVYRRSSSFEMAADLQPKVFSVVLSITSSEDCFVDLSLCLGQWFFLYKKYHNRHDKDYRNVQKSI